MYLVKPTNEFLDSPPGSIVTDGVMQDWITHFNTLAQPVLLHFMQYHSSAHMSVKRVYVRFVWSNWTLFQSTSHAY